MNRERAGSIVRRPTAGGAGAAAGRRTVRGRAADAMVAVAGLIVTVAFLGFLWWLEEDASATVWSAVGALSFVVGIGWGMHKYRWQQGAARYSAVIHRCDHRGEDGWSGVVAVTLPDGDVVRYPLFCWASGPRKRRASPVLLQGADGHLLQPGEPTGLAVRAVLATRMATYASAGSLTFFGILGMLSA